MPINPDSVLADLGRKVAELRTKAELTQEQLAERLNVSTRYFQGIEAGTHNLSVRALCRLADALKVAPAVLFERPKSRRPRPGRPTNRRDGDD